MIGRERRPRQALFSNPGEQRGGSGPLGLQCRGISRKPLGLRQFPFQQEDRRHIEGAGGRIYAENRASALPDVSGGARLIVELPVSPPDV